MNWTEHEARWPNAASSEFVTIGSTRWHVQRAGAGRTILLIHGAGGSCHSWRDCLPILAEIFDTIAIDLPGQGFSKSSRKSRFTLEHMTADLSDLLRHLEVTPAAVIGHSAGAAIALHLALTGKTGENTKLVSINGALDRFDGVAGFLFPLMAKLLALNPLTSLVFSKTASSEANVRRLIGSTGSDLDEEGLRLYRALISDREHVDGTLSMMANWLLDPLLTQLSKIENQTLFVAGSKDKAVPPAHSERAAAAMPNAVFKAVESLGHLMHEEAPELICGQIATFLRE